MELTLLELKEILEPLDVVDIKLKVGAYKEAFKIHSNREWFRNDTYKRATFIEKINDMFTHTICISKNQKHLESLRRAYEYIKNETTN